MKVLFISHDGSLCGGAGLALADLIISINEYNDVEPLVLIPSGTNELKEYLEKNNIEYIVGYSYWWAFVDRKDMIKNLYNYIKLFYYQIKMILKLPNLIKKIKEKEIDIIHTNSSVINIGALIKIFYNIPHIWHVREFGEEHLNLKFLFGTKYTRVFMERFSDRIVAISDCIKNKYLKYVKKKSVIRIYDGLPIKYKNIDNRKSNNNALRLLITGAIQEGKGQIDAIKLICNLVEKKYNVKLIVAGNPVNNEYYNYLKEVISKNRINDYVNFIGQCNEMNKLRNSIDVELICSCMEGFGRVSVEAMLSNLPVIASDSGANVELITDGLNGYIYKLGNVEDLEKKIVKLYNDRNIMNNMGKNGYKVAQENFIQDINTKKIYNLYKEILEERGEFNENRDN